VVPLHPRFWEILQPRLPGINHVRTEGAVVAGSGLFTYGTYPDIEGLIREQSTELNRGKREAILHRIQQLIHGKVM
jgi:hypothetical protein